MRNSAKKLITAICIILALFILLPLDAKAHTDPYTIGLRLNIGDEELLSTIVVSLKFLDEVMSIDRKDEKELKREEAKKAMPVIDSYFKDLNPVKIDGIRVRPVLKEVRFVPLTTKVLEEMMKKKNLKKEELPKGDVHIIYSYGTKGRPKQVSVSWELYPVDIFTDERFKDKVNSGWQETAAELVAYNDSRIIIFTKKEPEYIWHGQGSSYKNSLRVSSVTAYSKRGSLLFYLSFAVILPFVLPIVKFIGGRKYPRLYGNFSIIVLSLSLFYLTRLEIPYLSGPQFTKPAESEARSIFETLHRNIYRAFDYKTESDIYDALSQSVGGELLDDVYNEIYQSLIMREEGGAFATVQSVKILKSETAKLAGSASKAAFHVKALWQVHGAVSHWGHIHSRLNEYKALYTVEPRGDSWKITGVEILDQKRVVK